MTSPTTPTDTDLAEMAGRLTKAQRNELRAVRDEDRGCLARGDQAELVKAGLAVPPMGSSFYYLSRLGQQLRSYLLRTTKETNSD